MDETLDDYESGPDATTRAASAAWALAATARAVVLVEGVSDQIAVETAARLLGNDRPPDMVVIPIGGAHAVGNAITTLEPLAPSLVVVGLCDAGEESYFRRAFDRLPDHHTYFVCDIDLEDELIRAAGRPLVEQVITEQGDDRRFATMRKQEAWADAPFDAQVRRFVGAGARRKHRYATALVEALGPRRLPRPLRDLLDHVDHTRC